MGISFKNLEMDNEGSNISLMQTISAIAVLSSNSGYGESIATKYLIDGVQS